MENPICKVKVHSKSTLESKTLQVPVENVYESASSCMQYAQFSLCSVWPKGRLESVNRDLSVIHALMELLCRWSVSRRKSRSDWHSKGWAKTFQKHGNSINAVANIPNWLSYCQWLLSKILSQKMPISLGICTEYLTI